MPKGWRLSEEDKQAMVEQYQAGDSLSAIAERYGCVINNVRHILRRRGVEMRRRGNVVREFTDEQVRLIEIRWREGESQASLAKDFKTSQASIGRLLALKGITNRSLTGKRNHQWKGGRTVDRNGYIRILVSPDDPMRAMADTMGYVAEHRLVMARSLGRPLLPNESVHHIDGNRQNNTLENLQLRQGQHGTGIVLKCNDCGSVNIQSELLG